MATCKAIFRFSDDYGNNACTLRCQLEEGRDQTPARAVWDAYCLVCGGKDLNSAE